MLKPWFYLAGALLLTAVAWRTQGWAGVAMVASTVFFLMLMQFHRAMSVLRRAGAAPLGLIPSAVMLNARLKPGMSLVQLVQLAGSLGRPRPEGDDVDRGEQSLAWHDPGEAEVVVRLRRGKVVDWRFSRPPGADGAPPDTRA